MKVSFRTTLLFFFCITVFSSFRSTESITPGFAIPHLKSIIIDGEVEDWGNQGLVIPLVAEVWGETNPENLSATIRLAWNEENLFMLAEVKDDTLYQDQTGPIWRNDGMEIFLSTQKGSGQIIQYLISPALTEAFPEARVEKQNLRNPGQSHLIPDILIKSKLTEEGYTLEIAIPLSSLDLKPEEGASFALNFYLGDSDSGRKFQKYSWHYNDNSYLNHDALYEVVLTGKGKNQNILARSWLTDTTFYQVRLFSSRNFTKSIKLYNGSKELATSNFEKTDHFYNALFGFGKSEVVTFQQPLIVMMGLDTIARIEWLDIPRRYITIAPPNRFENEILIYEKQDAREFPPRGAALFVGSSSIRLWKTLQDDFPELSIINRGFGGSQTDEVLHFFNRIVAPYHAEIIVYFTGTNDLASGKPPEEVVENIEEFIRRVNLISPDTRIFILSNTIAVSRKHLHERYRETNRQLIEMLKKYDNAVYVDVTNPGLQPNGQPRPEIYTSDSLHLNSTGYKMWADILRPVLLGEE